MSIKSNAIIIRDETAPKANTATRIGSNLVEIADDLSIRLGETTGTNTGDQTASDIGLGWGQYGDTVYTVSSPFVINSGSVATLPNNALSNITTYLPSGVSSFYDSVNKKIIPQNIGDYYSINIRFKAKNTNVNGVFDIGLDIGGGLGIIFKETFLFAKGAGVEQDFNIVITGYSLDTFSLNGGIPKITSILGNTSVYNISYQITRMFSNGN